MTDIQRALLLRLSAHGYQSQVKSRQQNEYLSKYTLKWSDITTDSTYMN